MLTLLKRFLQLGCIAGPLAVAACSNGPARPAAGATSAAPVSASDVDTIQSVLMRGDRKGAENLLKPLLKREPMNPRLLLLRDSIRRDPKELLGPVSYPYTVRSGESFEEIAARLLGNRLKAYQLARYNGLDNPSKLAAGQTIQVPGSPPQPRPTSPTERPGKINGATATPRPAPTPPAAPVAKPAASPAAAQRARAAGLAALNRGAINDALVQLRRARALDPTNPVIARDLQRAERIAATVRAKK